MYEEIQVGLDGVVTPERMDVLLETYRQLTKSGLDALNDELIGIFNMQDGIADNAMFASRVEDCLMIGAIEVLRTHGITVNPQTAEMTTLTDTIQTLNDFEHYIVPEVLVGLVGPDEEPDLALASVVALFTDSTEDDVINAVDAVETSVIERMRAVAERQMEYEAEAQSVPPDHNERIGHINTLIRQYEGRHPAIVMEMAEHGIPSGQRLNNLFEQVFEQIDGYTPKELGVEFLGLVLYSDTPLSDVYEVASGLPQEFTDSHSEQYRIGHALDQAFSYIKGGSL